MPMARLRGPKSVQVGLSLHACRSAEPGTAPDMRSRSVCLR